MYDRLKNRKDAPQKPVVCNTGHESILRCLLTATLFFSIFTSLPHLHNASNALKEKVKIELVYSSISKLANNSVAYKKSFYTKGNSCLGYRFGEYELFALLYFNRLEKIKFDQNLKCCHFVSTPEWRIQLKIIPQNSSKGCYFSSIG